MRKSDVDLPRFIDIMTGSRFAAPIYRTCDELIVEQRFLPAGLAMPLVLKDIHSVLAAAETIRVPMPAASLARGGPGCGALNGIYRS
jgi:3-hydroxyisobutyrate dehydrogenase-like beta-hydroxyacid dehydrogenase